MASFFLLMARYPDVQRRAQADVDNIAPNRLPTLDDYDSLPYIRAMIKEIIRWAPVAPLGLNHAVLEDDVYENYFIPKGTKIIANIWYAAESFLRLRFCSWLVRRRAITHDEELYPDSFTFDPSRHLGDKPQTDPFKFVFGFGRRICPGNWSHVFSRYSFTYRAVKGAYLAEMSLFLNICNVLSVFNISKPLDANGVEVEPEEKWTTGITTWVILSFLWFYWLIRSLVVALVTLNISSCKSSLVLLISLCCWRTEFRVGM